MGLLEEDKSRFGPPVPAGFVGNWTSIPAPQGVSGGQRSGNLSDARNADGSPYQWSGMGAAPAPQSGGYSQPSYGMPQSSYVPAPPQPGRWDENASYQQRLNHFGDPNSRRDAQSELLAVKGLYDTRAAAGDMSGANAAHEWAKEVRRVSGIPEADFTYGNGPAPQMIKYGEADRPSNAIPGASYRPAYAPPPNTNLYPQMTPERIAAQAAAKVQAAIQQRTRAADQAKQGIQTSYSRLRTNIGQDRSAENVYNDRNLSPFSGRSDFAKGMVEQERARTDREQSADLQTRLANIDVGLEDFINASDEQRQTMINDMTRQERDYGMQVDQMQFNQWDANRKFDRGAFENDRSFDYGKQRDNVADTGRLPDGSYTQQGQSQMLTNQINQLKLANLPQELKANLEILDQQVKTGRIGMEEAQFKLKELSDPNSVTNQKNALELQMKQLEAQYAEPEMKAKLEQIRKQTAQIGAAPYRSPTEIEMDRVKLDAAKAELNNLTNPQAKRQTAEDYASATLNKIAQRDTDGNITNPQQVESSILLSPLSDYEKYKAYNMYGLKWTGPIPSPN